MAGHVLTITFSSDTNTDAMHVLPEALESFGWDGTSDPAVFTRSLIRQWAINHLAGLLRGNVIDEATNEVNSGVIDVD